MLKFFEKYQRFFFALVTAIIIGSFAFFGTFDSFSGQIREAEDWEVCKMVDGSPMMYSDVQKLSRFIASESLGAGASSRTPVNLCNDGVIMNDLLRTGLADLIVSAYFEAFQGDLKQRLERAKNYRMYEHPEAAFMNARLVWDKMAPSIAHDLEGLKGQKEESVSTFSHLSRLYLQQVACPPEFVRRILMYYQNQASWAKPDPYLQHADLSLFGFHTIADWFGANFIDAAAQFILNGAKCAEKKGIEVSLEEAKGDLLHNFQTSLQKLKEMKQDAAISFAGHLRSLGFDENSAAEMWRKVLLFRRYFHGIGASTFVDELPYREFASFARDEYLVQKFNWSPSLHLKDFWDLVEFQVYLQAISPSKDPLSLPKTFYSQEQIEKECSDLVQASYLVKMTKATLEEAGLKASMKDVLAWQLEDPNWESLKSQFPFLEKGSTKEERFEKLEKLTLEQRGKIDQYARNRLAEKNVVWIDELLSSKPSSEKEIFVAKEWVSLPRISNASSLGSLIELASLGNDDAKLKLQRFSDKGKVFYRFEEIEAKAPKHVLTFEEAKKLGIAKVIAENFLESEYVKMRPKMVSKFQVKEGEWKNFSSVKEEVGSIVFADLLKKIGGENKPLAYYAAHRLEVPTNEAWRSLKENSEDSQWLSANSDPLSDQFKLVRSESSIMRTTKEEWMKEQVLILLPNEWSPVHVPADGDISFFYFDKKKPMDEPILEQIALGKEIIAADAERYAAQSLLTKIQQKKSITIPIQKDFE